jgi:hypothetical protein
LCGSLSGSQASGQQIPRSPTLSVRASTAARTAARSSPRRQTKDALLPNVIAFTPGTVALWDPWFYIQNGKGIIEDIASNIIKMIVNQDFSSGLKPEPVLDYFPYLSPPPAS